jgi:acylphosphatase
MDRHGDGQGWMAAGAADILKGPAALGAFRLGKRRLVGSPRAAVAPIPAMADPRQAQPERRQAYYSGHVQGVGFRYTVRQLAEGFEVAGFVRNLPDGRVDVTAEGTPTELDAFMAAIADRMSGYIRDVKVDVRPVVGEFDRFEIRH